MIRNERVKLLMRWGQLFSWCMGILLVLAMAIPAVAATNLPQVVLSRDNTPISYEVYGSGEPTLVFVHGWSCDSRYWRMQIDQFAKKYRVVVLDLAGHGQSGMTRRCYSMRAFAEDVRAVVEAVGSKTVILIGHSMGGEIVAHAARMMPERVIGLIGVDTLENVEYPLSRQEAEAMLAPMIDDFRKESRAFVGTMFRPGTDPAVRQWVLADMSSAPPSIAMESMEAYLFEYVNGGIARVFDGIKVPVVCVNGDVWPVDFEANRRHMKSFEAITVPGGDHFLMLDKPNAFNQALEQAVYSLLRKAAAGK
ncbi:MAG: alpha/beta hydrolase [Desulfobulbus sp.]|nr:alpha/beta hydrolase [Desulfobulbus sp.]